MSPTPFIPPDHPDLPNGEHSGDAIDLALKWKGKLSEPVLVRFLRQIHGGAKTTSKLPSWNAAGVAFPAAISLEQCSSEATARYKASLVSGKFMADLTAGFGVDAWALASKFERVYYVEQNPELCQHADYNFKKLGVGNIQLKNASAEDFLSEQSEKLDLFFIDPARRLQSQKVFQLQDCEPRLDWLWPILKEKSNSILVKLSPLIDLKNLHRQLSGNFDVHVVSVENECKEVLLKTTEDKGRVVAVLLNEDVRTFSFLEEEERAAEVTYSEPLHFLYEPDVALLKAGAYRSLCTWFNVKKLAPNSHLYTSEQRIENFPGRTFEIMRTLDFSPKKIKKEKMWNKANITTRNFPVEVSQIRAQTGIKDGGATYLFATTLLDDRLVLIECQKGLQ